MEICFIGSTLTTSGSGEWFAFTYNNENWELKKFDSEDDALSLCTFESKLHAASFIRNVVKLCLVLILLFCTVVSYF